LGLVPIPLSGSHATSNPPLKRKLLWSWIANGYFATLPDQWLSLTTPLQYRRYVALKFAVAELTGKNSELKIHRHLASQSASHPGSERVLALLDHFTVQGVNGEHDVSVSQVIGPHLEAMFDDDPAVIQQTVKSLVHQVALGTSFLHHCGVVHAGRSATLSTEAEYKIDWYNLDLHKGNIAFEIPDLDGTPEEMVMITLGVPPHCVPVVTRDQLRQTDSLPKYLVFPGNLVDLVKQDDMRVKIIDLGEGSFVTISTVLSSIKVLQHSSVPRYLKTCTPRYKFGHRRPSSTISRRRL
jgi:serine/threonine-protein kinase SRPK3